MEEKTEIVTLEIVDSEDVLSSPKLRSPNFPLKDKSDDNDSLDSGQTTPVSKDDFDDLSVEAFSRKFSLQEDKVKIKMIPDFEVKKQITNVKRKYQKDIEELKDEVDRLTILLREEKKKNVDPNQIQVEEVWNQKEFDKKLKEEIGVWVKRVENLEKKNKEYREIIHKAEKELDKKLL